MIEIQPDGEEKDHLSVPNPCLSFGDRASNLSSKLRATCRASHAFFRQGHMCEWLAPERVLDTCWLPFPPFWLTWDGRVGAWALHPTAGVRAALGVLPCFVGSGKSHDLVWPPASPSVKWG